MEFVVENLTPTRKQISLKFSAADVDAAIDAAVAGYRKTLALPGFRKGKVPASVIERRFGEEIYSRAARDTINSSVQDILKEQNLDPLSGIELDAAEDFARHTAYACSLRFDALPEIDFPPYVGLKVEQSRSVLGDGEVDAVLERLRENFAETEEVTEKRLPQDGDVVDVDFAGFDEAGNPVKDVAGKHFTIRLGKKQVLDDFENLVKTALPGEEKEGPVHFPDDYGHAELAGKTVTMRIRVNSLKVARLPELDDDFARKTGRESLEKLREAIAESTLSGRREAAKGEAMKKLLDGLLAQATFELPETMVKNRTERLLGEVRNRLEQTEKKYEALGDDVRRELEEQARKDAVEAVRSEVFLMALGKKENIQVSDFEVDRTIYAMARRAGQDYRQIHDLYRRTGLLHELRDRILADKAMEFVYDKAEVTEVDPPAREASATPKDGAAD